MTLARRPFLAVDAAGTLGGGGGERRRGGGDGERRLRRGGERPEDRPEGAAPGRDGGPGGVRRRVRSTLRRRYGDLHRATALVNLGHCSLQTFVVEVVGIHRCI